MYFQVVAWQPYADFVDFIVGMMQLIWGAISNSISSLWMLLRMTINIVSIPSFLATHVWSPIAICGAFVVIVGIVKIFVGRDSQ